MKLLIICISILVFAAFCGKSYKNAPDDGTVNGRIRGRLFLLDTQTTQKIYIPLPNKTITIFYQESQDTVNYLFATPTDKDGYFVFDKLNKLRNYRVFYEERDDSDRIYTGIRPNIKPNIDTLTLNANINLYKESGLLYTVTDGSNPLKGVNVCIFNNFFFQPGKCDNSRYPLVTDNYGHAFKFNIPSGTYYTTAYIQANGSIYLANDTPSVGATILPRTLTLKKSVVTEYDYLVRDAHGNPLANASLCLFSSDTAYKTGDCANANIPPKVSGPDGKVKITDFEKGGKFFVIGKYQGPGLTLAGNDTILIEANKLITDTITLK